jgi:hypothetical protein
MHPGTQSKAVMLAAMIRVQLRTSWAAGVPHSIMQRESRVKAKREFTVVVERDEDGLYVGHVPELRGRYAQAKNPDTLMKRSH